jgi:hypothetical protein
LQDALVVGLGGRSTHWEAVAKEMRHAVGHRPGDGAKPIGQRRSGNVHALSKTELNPMNAGVGVVVRRIRAVGQGGHDRAARRGRSKATEHVGLVQRGVDDIWRLLANEPRQRPQLRPAAAFLIGRVHGRTRLAQP